MKERELDLQNFVLQGLQFRREGGGGGGERERERYRGREGVYSDCLLYIGQRPLDKEKESLDDSIKRDVYVWGGGGGGGGGGDTGTVREKD